MQDNRICEKSKSHKIQKSAYSTFCCFLRTKKIFTLMRSECLTDYQTIAKNDNLETITNHSKSTKLYIYVTTLFIYNSRLP